MRLTLIILAFLLAALQTALPCDRCGYRYRHDNIAPLPVSASAVDEQPGRFAYWKAYINANGVSFDGSQQSTELTGYSSPVVSDAVFGNGSLNVQFVFYDKDGQIIKSLRRTGRPDRGSGRRHHPDYGYRYPDSPFYYGGGFQPLQAFCPAPGGAAVTSTLNQPWPRGTLDFRLSGGGPWTVELSAGANLPPEQIVSHEWDFDHDGEFNFNSGRSPSVSRKLTKAGKYIFSVRITDLRGYSSTAEVEVVVPAAQ